MSFTYEYKVNGLKIQDKLVANTTFKNAVFQTYWTLIATDENGNEGIFNGITPFELDPNDESKVFIPFDKLKEEDVTGWISNMINSDISYKNHIDECIKKQIENNSNPITEPSLPWAPTSNTANTVV